jgi:hypothetical protein
VRVASAVWDPAGLGSWPSLWRSHYGRSHGVLVVYDITDRQSWTYAKQWFDDVRNTLLRSDQQQDKDKTVPPLLLGTLYLSHHVSIIIEPCAHSLRDSWDQERSGGESSGVSARRAGARPRAGRHRVGRGQRAHRGQRYVAGQQHCCGREAHHTRVVCVW